MAVPEAWKAELGPDWAQVWHIWRHTVVVDRSSRQYLTDIHVADSCAPVFHAQPPCLGDPLLQRFGIDNAFAIHPGNQASPLKKTMGACRKPLSFFGIFNLPLRRILSAVIASEPQSQDLNKIVRRICNPAFQVGNTVSAVIEQSAVHELQSHHLVPADTTATIQFIKGVRDIASLRDIAVGRFRIHGADFEQNSLQLRRLDPGPVEMRGEKCGTGTPCMQ